MIIYLVKSTLLLALLLGVYKLLLENEKMHQFNRFFLLFALVFGLSAPLITFDLSTNATVVGIKLEQMERVVNVPAEIISKSITTASQPNPVTSQNIVPAQASSSFSISKKQILWAIYGLISFILITRFGSGLYQLFSTIRSGETKSIDGATLVLVKDDLTPQSFLKFIFLNEEDFRAGKIGEEILEHERTHVRQLHSLDVLFIEILKVIFWFNPVLYFYKYSIQLNHEFIADEKALHYSKDIASYQSLLLGFISKAKQEGVTSNLNFSLTKKRFLILGKSFSSLRSSSKSLLTVCLVSFLSFVFCTQTKINSDELYTNVQLQWVSSPYQQVQYSGGYYDSRMVDTNGDLFTGTQNYYFKKNDQLFISTTFKEGVRIKEQTFKENGEELYRMKIDYDFEKDERISLRRYDLGVLTLEIVDSSAEHNDKQVYRERYPNGQLKFEMFSYSEKDRPIVYDGLMTRFDQQGIILEQERYENGILVEKIK